MHIKNLAPNADTIIVTSEDTMTTIYRDEDGCVHVTVRHNCQDNTGAFTKEIRVIERHLVLGVAGDLT